VLIHFLKRNSPFLLLFLSSLRTSICEDFETSVIPEPVLQPGANAPSPAPLQSPVFERRETRQSEDGDFGVSWIQAQVQKS
jgi:hypothetical protein